MNKIKKMLILVMVMVLSMNLTAFAAESDSVETEVESFEELDSWEGESDQSVDGIYNTNSAARAALTGTLRLSQSGTTLIADYASTYSTTVNRIGVRNVRLMYKNSLKLWSTIVTLDDRYRTSACTYAGAFSVTGTYGRVYMLSCTHYYTDTLSSGTTYNETGELTFK